MPALLLALIALVVFVLAGTVLLVLLAAALLAFLALLLAGLLARLWLLLVLLLFLLVVLRAHILVVRHDRLFLVTGLCPPGPSLKPGRAKARSEETLPSCFPVPLLQKVEHSPVATPGMPVPDPTCQTIKEG
jgi:hypothetical protein